MKIVTWIILLISLYCSLWFATIVVNPFGLHDSTYRVATEKVTNEAKKLK